VSEDSSRSGSESKSDTALSRAFGGPVDGRLSAGRVALLLLRPKVTLVRRVEKISWIGTGEFERRVSVTVNNTSALRRAEESGLSLDLYFLGLLPKSLFRDFDSRDAAGTSLALASRELDSRVAQSFLVALAHRRVPDLPEPSVSVWDRLFLSCYRFPNETPPMSPDEVSRWAASLGDEDLSQHRVEGLDHEDGKWWAQASADPIWAWWLRRFVVNFAVLAHAADAKVPARAVIKYRWVELNPQANLGPRRERGLARERGGFGYRIPLYDFGRAASEHVHVLAPPETFLTDGVITRGLGRLDVRSRVALHSQSFYMGPRNRTRSPGLCRIHLRVLPEPRALLSPLQLLAAYSSLLMLGLTVLQGTTNLAAHIRTSLDALVALAFFLPSLVLPLLFKRDEHDLRWRLLQGWRDLVLVLFASLPVTLVLLLSVPSSGARRWILTGVFATLSIYVWWLALRLLEDARRVNDVRRQVEKLELKPAKGQRVDRPTGHAPTEQRPITEP
jgi:hypothetical protein